MVLSVTFSHEYETFKGLRDFEKLFIQSVYNENNLDRLLSKFDVSTKDISYVSSIKIYKHSTGKLTKKAELIKQIPATIEFEREFLKTLNIN